MAVQPDDQQPVAAEPVVEGSLPKTGASRIPYLIALGVFTGAAGRARGVVDAAEAAADVAVDPRAARRVRAPGGLVFRGGEFGQTVLPGAVSWHPQRVASASTMSKPRLDSVSAVGAAWTGSCALPSVTSTRRVWSAPAVSAKVEVVAGRVADGAGGELAGDEERVSLVTPSNG
ncbi:hypothetical protein ACU686_40140 [Yinghuangia aomiensis]